MVQRKFGDKFGDSNEAACFTKIFLSFRKESCLADVEEENTCEDWPKY